MKAARRFRKKPVEVDAIQLVEHLPMQTFLNFIGDVEGIELDEFGVSIDTLEGTMYAGAGDWIIRGVKGEFYPCKPDIFEVTYEPVESEEA